VCARAYTGHIHAYIRLLGNRDWRGQGETEKDEKVDWEKKREATVMDRPISAARWSTRETERTRRRDQKRIFSTYGMVRDGRWKKRETKNDRERERSWSGRSLANRRTQGGPVAVPCERNSTSAILLRHYLSLDQLLCNLLSTSNEFSSARLIVVIELWHYPIKSQLARILESLTILEYSLSISAIVLFFCFFYKNHFVYWL